MNRHLKCSECGKVMTPLTFWENGEKFVDGLECDRCGNREVTSIMNLSEYIELVLQPDEGE